MPTTKRDLAALHYLAQRLRAETYGAGEWHDNGLTSVLAKLEGQNLAIVTERVTRHAADKDARTPAAIERPFVPGPPTPGVRYPAKAGSPDECRHHPGEHADHCRACAGDRLAGDPPTPPRQQRGAQRHGDHIAAARAALTDARARLCVHGATICHDCDREGTAGESHRCKTPQGAPETRAGSERDPDTTERCQAEMERSKRMGEEPR